jgi:hypothetical protein
MKLASLESGFQYESSDTDHVQYNEDFVAQFILVKVSLGICVRLIYRNRGSIRYIDLIDWVK